VLAFTDLLRQRQCEPETLDLHVSRHTGAHQIAVLVRYSSVPAAVDDGCRQTRACADQIGATVEEAEGEEAQGWWTRHMASTGGSNRLRVRLSWRPSEFERASAALVAAAGDARFDWIGRAAVGSGVVAIDGDVTRFATMVSALRSSDALRHVVIEDAPVALRRTTDVWEVSDTQQALWQALKSACDPRDTLNAGRGPL
jgi:hypothetical protein